LIVDILGEDLDGERPPRLPLDGAINDAHPAATGFLAELEAVLERFESQGDPQPFEPAVVERHVDNSNPHE